MVVAAAGIGSLAGIISGGVVAVVVAGLTDCSGWWRLTKGRGVV